MSAVPRATMPIPKGGSLALPLGDAVERLAALWTATGSDDGARLLAVLSNAFATYFDVLPKKGQWFERIARGETDDASELAPSRYLDVLLRAVTDGPEPRATDRLSLVASTFCDPRIGPWLDRWDRAKPYGSGFRAALTLAREAQTRATRDAAERWRPLTDEDRTVLVDAERLVASLPRRRAAFAMLRAIHAEPRSRERRLVFADALSELGDPWGEFIVLQDAARDRARTPAIAAREAELLALHGTTWMGRLRDEVQPASVVFEGGFPAAAIPLPSARSVRVAEWATLERLVGPEGYSAGWMLACHTVARRVRDHVGLTLAFRGGDAIPALRLPRDGPTHLRVMLQGNARAMAALTRWGEERPPHGLRRLDYLGYSPPDLLDTLLAIADTRFGARLTDIGISGNVTEIVDAIGRRVSAGRPVPVIHTLNDAGFVRFEASTRRLTVRLNNPLYLRRLAEAIARCGVAELRIEAGPSSYEKVNENEKIWQTTSRVAKLELVRA